VEHRVSNSLQIIASIDLMKAWTARSETTRPSSVRRSFAVHVDVAVQEHLHASGAGRPVENNASSLKLCETLATSMIGDIRPISLKVGSDEEVRLPVRPSASA
jgi:two-component sensor histidine kinase